MLSERAGEGPLDASASKVTRIPSLRDIMASEKIPEAASHTSRPTWQVKPVAATVSAPSLREIISLESTTPTKPPSRTARAPTTRERHSPPKPPKGWSVSPVVKPVSPPETVSNVAPLSLSTPPKVIPLKELQREEEARAASARKSHRSAVHPVGTISVKSTPASSPWGFKDTTVPATTLTDIQRTEAEQVRGVIAFSLTMLFWMTPNEALRCVCFTRLLPKMKNACLLMRWR